MDGGASRRALGGHVAGDGLDGLFFSQTFSPEKCHFTITLVEANTRAGKNRPFPKRGRRHGDRISHGGLFLRTLGAEETISRPRTPYKAEKRQDRSVIGLRDPSSACSSVDRMQQGQMKAPR